MAEIDSPTPPSEGSRKARRGVRVRGLFVAAERWPTLLVFPGLLFLVWDPAQWLWRSWRDPSYQSDGALVAITVAILLAVSVWSGSAAPDPRARRRAWQLMAATAGIRLLGRLLAVNTVGALALAVDVAALALFLGVSRRPFALDPGVLAALFVLALPVEHLLQRTMGHPLQLLAAGAAESLLSPFFPALTREGVLLMHPSIALAVDLPCSGARGLVLFSAIALGVASMRRFGVVGGARALAAVALGAFLANTLRILGLFVGSSLDLPVVEEPWHSGLGALALALGALPLLAATRTAVMRRPLRRREDSQVPTPSRVGWRSALLATVVGGAVASAPHHPLDQHPPVQERHLPTSLDRLAGVELPLPEVEKRYYGTWGGSAEKRVYDDGSGLAHTALLVRTRSPLRHLHGPDRCLLGAGHRVTRLGVVPGPPPTVLYKSIAPDGRAWRVEASFVSDGGERATGVSEVVWRWLATPSSTWSLVERISPWELCETHPRRCVDFDRALFTSLDVSTAPAPIVAAATAPVPPTLDERILR